MIVKVADAADGERETQLEVTDQVLAGLGCTDLPQLTVYNKVRQGGRGALAPGVLLTSAKTGRGLPALLAALRRRPGRPGAPGQAAASLCQARLAEPMRTGAV